MKADLKWTEYLCMYFQDTSLAMIFGWHSSDATYRNNLLQPLMIVKSIFHSRIIIIQSLQ